MVQTLIKNKKLKKRIITISYKYNLSHIGSCLTAVDIIDEIYKVKKPSERFVLSSGHAGLALYVVLEKYEGINAEKVFKHHGVHPNRCEKCYIDCSTGSLGLGLSIAVGMALADRSKQVYCLISDGETAEGSIWEAIRIYYDQNIKPRNLSIYINWNWWTAYGRPSSFTWDMLHSYWNHISVRETNMNDFKEIKELQDQSAHYHVLNEENYKLAMKILK